MLKFSKLAAVAVLGLIVTGPAQADDAKAVATVNGVAIPESRVNLSVEAAAHRGQADSPDLRKAVRENLINLEVISQAATKKGLDKSDDVAEELTLARENVLVNAYFKDFIQNHPISEDALKKEYADLKEHLGNKEYKVAHILVKTEKEAQNIRDELVKKKASFAKLAKQDSQDPGSAENGGELGWNVPANFVAPFADAVQSLSKGEISAPVQTQFGWHIIKLEGVRTLKVPPFEQVKPNLIRRLQQQAIQKEILDLRGKAKIE
jgi:peptidyl-prolyl cis-trans isomerase C